MLLATGSGIDAAGTGGAEMCQKLDELRTASM
jgi:hypothetical protein